MSIRAGIFIILVLMGGCTGDADADRAAALYIWNSTNATPQERTEAVNRLIPVGAEKEEVERILGKSGRLVHFHAMNINHEEDSLEYPVPGGAIAIILRPAGQGRLVFVTAVVTALQEHAPEPARKGVQKGTKP